MAFKYFGLFQVLQKIGLVAYKLQLPEGSSVHPVFHVSQLKKMVGSSDQVSSHIPEPAETHHLPAEILAEKLHHQNGKIQPKILVKWQNWPTNMATWEKKDDLRQLVEGTLSRGQDSSLGGEDVSSQDSITESTGDEDGPRRSKRAARPSKKYKGSEWLKM